MSNIVRIANGGTWGSGGSYYAYIGQSAIQAVIDIGLVKVQDHKSYHMQIENGEIKWYEHDPYGMVKPFLSILKIEDADAILGTLADALDKYGYFPEVSKERKDKAEAIAEERQENIEYMRGFIEKMVLK